MRKWLPRFVIIAIMFAPCVALFGTFWGIPTFREWKIKQNFKVIDGARMVFSDMSTYGANSAQKSVYYWSAESLDEVTRYYQDFATPFLTTGDEYGAWRIAGLGHLDTIPTASEGRNIGHRSFCHYKNHYKCITISLVDASQKDIYRLGVSSTSSFRRSENPPGLASMPVYGTLIIYSYYIDDF
ncbi:MAG TPA: hypothetical protein PKD09_04200 [Aggregatilinea sp.]|uniref:hypothetical protein n=1 Tax=Aggregatilinea sp. TaxID=2806333 RepID=UPI002D06DB3D|nr:hypothetical protein [Aggregatilinea sp.]HML20825.1 hypothetical protein [Aggregatilinea sp.]